MGLDNDRQKISLLPSWSGPDLLVFWEREVNIRFADVPAVIVDGVEQVPAAVAHTYAELIDLRTQTAGAKRPSQREDYYVVRLTNPCGN